MGYDPAIGWERDGIYRLAHEKAINKIRDKRYLRDDKGHVVIDRKTGRACMIKIETLAEEEEEYEKDFKKYVDHLKIERFRKKHVTPENPWSMPRSFQSKPGPKPKNKTEHEWQPKSKAFSFLDGIEKIPLIKEDKTPAEKKMSKKAAEDNFDLLVKKYKRD